MNITKYYPRIVQALYHSPWMILPNAHETLRKGFEAHINGQLPEIPINDEDGDDEDILTNISPSTAVITIEGVIGKRLGMLEQCMGGCDVDIISDQLDMVEANPNIQNIVLDFHTPGGSVVGVPELANKISNLTKPTIAYTDTLCASAGYYLASQCKYIYASPSAELGSVGVYSIYMDESRALDNAGIKVNAISAGKYKLVGAPFKAMTDEEKEMLQADIDKIYNQFKSAVVSKRNIKDEDLQGQVFSGEDLVDKNFIDGNIDSMKGLLQFLDNHSKQ